MTEWRGNPRCESCHGSGLMRTTNGKRPCHCIKGTSRQLLEQHRQRTSTPGYKSVTDLIRDHEQDRSHHTREDTPGDS